MAWVIKRKRADGGTSYRVGWRDPAGDLHWKTFRRRREADDFARGIEGDKLTGNYVDPAAGKMLLADYFDHFMEVATHLKPSSAALYRYLGDTFIKPALGKSALASIGPSDVKGYLATLSKRVGPSTVQSVYRLLRRVLNAAVEDGRIARNPAARLKLRREAKREHRILEPEEIDRLAAEIDPRYRAVVYLMGYGGLRIGEVAALRLADIDFLRGRVYVRRNSVEVEGVLVEGSPKGGAIRTVRIPKTVVEILSRHVEGYVAGGPDARMFTSEEGRTLRQSRFRKTFFGPAAKRAGLAPLRPHDLRHTAVALAIKAGYHPRAIQELAGHASITMTMDTYGALFDTLQEAGVERLDEIARGRGGT